MLGRKDISLEANIERRKFWEMCASRRPVIITHYYERRVTNEFETPQEVADWSDRMVSEWDKRWIAEDEKGSIEHSLAQSDQDEDGY